MAVVVPTTVYSAVTSALSNPVTPTEEERLFDEAFENVKREKQLTGNVSVFFQGLSAAKNADEALQILQRERGQNAVWHDQKGSKKLQALNKLANSILILKPFVDQLVSLGSKVIAPVWGGIAFVLAVVKDLSTADGTLKKVQDRLKWSMERFSEYYRLTEDTKGSLRTSLLRYYECIIVFVLDLQVEFAHSWAKTLLKTVIRTVKDKVESFDKDLRDSIEDVDKAANVRSQNELRDQNKQIQKRIDNIPIQLASIVPTISGSNTTRSFIYGLPDMLSRAFTGRADVIRKIRNHRIQQPQDLIRTSVYGLGGIGKTQILLKYATQFSYSSAHTKAYTSIIYFDARTDAAVLQVLISLANCLRPTSPPEDQKQVIVADFHKWLRSQQDWLLIFDNVENLDHVRDCLPPTRDTGHIIFATRHRSLADILPHDGESIEVLPMEDTDAINLAHTLAQRSDIADDKTLETATRVAEFARGVPLVIEQIVHNAMAASRSISSTLDLVRNKADLLEQGSVSSLRGRNSSIGAIVMQSMTDLKARYADAETLFKIMVYWSTAAIPMHMVRKGAGQLQTYLQRQYTFDRGQITRVGDNLIDRIKSQAPPRKFNLFDLDPFKSDTWLELARFKSRRKKYTETDLPLDDTTLEAALRIACCEDSPIGRLFKSEAAIQQAEVLLVGSGLVRRTHTDTLWIHDLFSEMAMAIIQRDESFPGPALTAATLVYLAFPVPTKRPSHQREHLCQQYLPHAMSCHQHLKSLGILNNLSLGPELSHVIASVFCMRTPLAAVDTSMSFSINPLQHARRERQDRNDNAIIYYRSALAGYLASQKRIESLPGMTAERIALATSAEEIRESLLGCTYHDYVDDLQRFGRNPQWRVVQTALRLSDILEQGNFEDLEASIPITRLALKMQEHFFGDDHDDTILTRKEFFNRLYDIGNLEEAYDVAILGLKKLVGWSEEKQKYCGTGKKEHTAFSSSVTAVFFCRGAGMCCLELPDHAGKAIAYIKVYLQYCQDMRGEEHFWSVEPMQQLALAYEKCGEKLASIYWLGRSVQCALRSLEIEGHSYYDGEEIERIIWRSNLVKSETVMEEAVARYEEARERFGVFTEPSLRKFLSAVDSRISLWRNDRQNFGSPYNDADSKVQAVLPLGEALEEFVGKTLQEAEKRTVHENADGSTSAGTEDQASALPGSDLVVPNVPHP